MKPAMLLPRLERAVMKFLPANLTSLKSEKTDFPGDFSAIEDLKLMV